MEDIRKGVCPMCRHNEIVEARNSAWASMGNAAVPDEKTRALGRRNIEEIKQRTGGPYPPPLTPGGLLGYACRACGFYQEFVKDCAAVPIDEWYGTRLIKGAEPEGPYR
jgi:hypothetical protein